MDKSKTSEDKLNLPLRFVESLLEEITQIEKEDKNTEENMKRVQEIISKSAEKTCKSTSLSELIVDAKILHTGSKFVNGHIDSLDTNLTTFSEQKYITGILSFIEEQETLQNNKGWNNFSKVTYQMFKKSHPLTFMLGTFSLEEPPVEEIKKIERHKKAPVPPKEVLESSQVMETRSVEESDICDHILKHLVKQYNKNNKKPISFFNFVIDPTSYWKSMENIFYFSFLVRDGTAKISLVKKLPHIEPVLQNKGGTPSKRGSGNQFVISLNKARWKELIDCFLIQSPGIPSLPSKKI